MTPEIEIKEGRIYLDRKGRKVGPFRFESRSDPYLMIDEKGRLFMRNGHFWEDGSDDPRDIVSEAVSEARRALETQPEKP